MDLRETYEAADLLTAAATAVIASGDDEIARELVPEIHRLRMKLVGRALDRRIKFDQESALRSV